MVEILNFADNYTSIDNLKTSDSAPTCIPPEMLETQEYFHERLDLCMLMDGKYLIIVCPDQ